MKALPPDQEQRDTIRCALDENLLVEAAAGTGKTTSMVERMIALLRTGACESIRTLAAVTFTRKAAAELRSRFQVKLEAAVREAAGEERARLEQARQHLEQCYLGTIHSFCARLLRERPVEAGVDVAFEEMEEEEDQRLREEAWAEYCARAFAEGFPEAEALAEVGLQLRELQESFRSFVEYPDVAEWPAPEVEMPDLAPAREELGRYLAHLESLAPHLPEAWGNDSLIPLLRRLPRLSSHYDLAERLDLMAVLGHFDATAKVVQREWIKTGHFDRDDAKREQARWDEFRARVAAPLLGAWREYRYPRVLRVLQAARTIYDEMRQVSGRLSYQDLLLKAAALLREKPHVREYFRDRFTHLLVDEFQDTDPIQAEVMLLLTAADPKETNWRDCVPRPGSLFVVGDPKQSIYRFRRADIVTYNDAKKIIKKSGRVVELSANFRTTKGIVDWVNAVFAPDPGDPDPLTQFPAEPCDESPQYVLLQSARREGTAGELTGLHQVSVPATCSRQREVVDYEADFIARTLRQALDCGLAIARREEEVAQGAAPAARPDDFLLITRNTTRLSEYARALQAYGIPHQVSGGAALNEVPELQLLHLCLKAVTQPDNPVALVAVLRSELFGLSDRALYALKQAGGEFRYQADLPVTLAAQHAATFGDAFGRLQRYRDWLAHRPPIAAIERIVADLGLMARAAARAGGEISAGGLAKAIEVLRAGQAERWSVAHLVEHLGRLVALEERYDGISARSREEPAVRLMNLHKVKGLEAPVVFLADPYGESQHDVALHIDRSSPVVQGYLAIYGRPRGYAAELLATPPGWEELAARERGFAEAEGLRLRYVAATRAGSALVITSCEKGNRTNPWGCFLPHLPAGCALPDPGTPAVTDRETVVVTAEEVAAAQAAIAARGAAVAVPTYATLAARQVAAGAAAVVGPEEGPVPDWPEGEHGMAWGTVIHVLLQAGMRARQADLGELARTALRAQELDPELAPRALAVVQAVMHSDLWQRAQRSPRRLVEAPFQVLEEGAAVPTLVRGVIDLVFEEAGGWVVVDYKTEALPGGRAEVATAKYAPQLNRYAQAWEQCTGQVVKERILFFVQAGRVVGVSP